MAVENPVFKQLVEAISPVVSIGVGSTVVKVCRVKSLDPNKLNASHLTILKPALLEHYKKFWESPLGSIQASLDKL